MESVKKVANSLRNDIIEKINSNIPPPNAPSTIKAKGSSHTLIDTGEMRRSIDFRVIGESDEMSEVSIGIFEEDIARYAIANEFGSSRTVTTKNKDNTDEMHQGYSQIVIPERSFMRSAYDQNIDALMDDLSAKIGDIVSKKFLDK